MRNVILNATNDKEEGNLMKEKFTKLAEPLTMFLKGDAIAIHNKREVEALPGGEIIHVHSEIDDYYVGHFAQPYGMLMINMKFKKSDCEKKTSEEIKEIFCKSHSEEDYKYWFGKDAV